MKQHHRTPRRLATAVAVTLAVTAGGLAATPAAVASPPAAVGATAEAESAPAVIDPTSALRGWGSSGFLSRVGYESEGLDYRWTRYADGVSTTLPATATPYVGAVGGDVVVRQDGTAYHLYDMAAGGEPVAVDTAFLGPSAKLERLVGRTLVMRTEDSLRRHTLHVVSTAEGGQAAGRAITGFPADTRIDFTRPAVPGLLVVRYTGTVNGVSGKRLAVVDLAEAKVVDDRSVPAVHTASNVSASATHVAWVERIAGGVSVVVTARRGSTATVRHTVAAQEKGLSVSLVGGWVLYGVTGGYTAEGPNPLHPLRAVPVTGGTPVTLLDSTTTYYGGGTELLVQGGTSAHGEGVYRFVPGADGGPVVTPVALTGLRTTLGVVAQSVPTTADFSAPGSSAHFDWRFGRGRAWVDFRITHSASGRTWTESRPVDDDRIASPVFGHIGFDWNGLFEDQISAPTGTYTWTMTATPTNGVGGVLKKSGTFEVTNKPVQHDYSGSAFPDLLTRNRDGQLVSYDTRQILFEPHAWLPWTGTNRGGGWSVYDRILATGNLDAGPASDLVARDRSGVLWFYANKGTALARRTPIGGGWNTYDKLAAGSDLTGDGRPDLVATDRSGVLWLYKATGDGTKPFAPRKRIGGGWGTYDTITAPGNLGGAKAGDLLARDRSGVLWLYLGKGDGTFAPRVRVGGGWDRMYHLIPIGDFGRDGRPDFLAVTLDRAGRTVFLRYKGTGDWRAPFEGAVTTPVDWDAARSDLLF
ncbi:MULTISPECIES: FG-GAP repeat domain-containing protein [Streptomyces]|uniref:VCBS repeat-containing protein n=2 Tax=Streptomyces TaxID=1883 RepID=A0ABU4JZB6_9ACTN|nr:VCBS repeat-containing protein [Streptomyces roseolus]MDX2290841.1 VCBS repeat-containing protein [Streptomyces roseolus]